MTTHRELLEQILDQNHIPITVREQILEIFTSFGKSQFEDGRTEAYDECTEHNVRQSYNNGYAKGTRNGYKDGVMRTINEIQKLQWIPLEVRKKLLSLLQIPKETLEEVESNATHTHD